MKGRRGIGELMDGLGCGVVWCLFVWRKGRDWMMIFKFSILAKFNSLQIRNTFGGKHPLK